LYYGGILRIMPPLIIRSARVVKTAVAPFTPFGYGISLIMTQQTKGGRMKNSIVVITAVFVLILSGMAFAQMMDKDKDTMGDKSGMMGDKGGMKEMMGGKGMMGKMGMMHEMMGFMMERKMIATSDGGVVIINGIKLDKFDKDLNLVKEIDLKPDMAGMQSMMDQMKQACPKMGKMMSKGMMGGGMMDNDNDKGSDVKESVENPSAQH
jgi:hypothetical protein